LIDSASIETPAVSLGSIQSPRRNGVDRVSICGLYSDQ